MTKRLNFRSLARGFSRCFFSIGLVVLAFNNASPLQAKDKARTPADVARLFEQKFNKQDVDGLLELYHQGSVFVPAPGQALSEAAAIRGALQQFLSANVPIKLQVRYVFESGDNALLIVDWSMKGTAADGKPMDLSGSGSDVVKKKKDGSWLYLIDNPFGTLQPSK